MGAAILNSNKLVRWNATGQLVDPTGVNPYGFAALPLDVNGYAVGNLIPRTDTLANFLLLAGGVNEIGVITDKDALFRFNGVVGGGKPYYRSKLIGKTTMTGVIQAGGAASTWTTVSFVGGTVIEDEIGGTADLANSLINIPVGVDYYEAELYVPWAEQAAATGVVRKGRFSLNGASGIGPAVIAPVNLAVTTNVSSVANGNLFKQVNPTSASIVIQSFHDSAGIPNLGFGTGTTANLARLTVRMYKN